MCGVGVVEDSSTTITVPRRQRRDAALGQLAGLDQEGGD